MATRTERHDSARFAPALGSGGQGVGQERGQEMVAEMVGSHLAFETVGGPTLGTGHDPGIRDEEIEIAALENIGCAAADRREGLEVQRHELEAFAGNALIGEASDSGLSTTAVTNRHEDMGTLGGERGRGALTQTGGGPGDEDPAAGGRRSWAHRGDHIVDRGVEAELVHRPSMPFAPR